MPVSPYIMKNNFLVLLRGNNCCTISDISAQYKRVQDYQAGSNGRTIQRAKLTVRCPHHPDCHCTLDPIPYTIVVSNAAAHSAYSKFDPYLFNTRGEHPHGKDKLFHEWGYTVVDAFWLQKEIERQAREKYVSGNYELGRLNFAGQRISIRIEIPRRNGDGTVSFISGWMVEPTGEIRLTTPYGGE